MTENLVEKIGDDELLYRCVFYQKETYKLENGRLIVSSQAFNDRGSAPSVDRALLCCLCC